MQITRGTFAREEMIEAGQIDCFFLSGPIGDLIKLMIGPLFS